MVHCVFGPAPIVLLSAVGPLLSAVAPLLSAVDPGALLSAIVRCYPLSAAPLLSAVGPLLSAIVRC